MQYDEQNNNNLNFNEDIHTKSVWLMSNAKGIDYMHIECANMTKMKIIQVFNKDDTRIHCNAYFQTLKEYIACT